ncbi:MAG: hypothetical protein Q8J84_09040 [Flavobacteriaceae bacterium]|nr:hypothetical protein [Flavobacteriaceae bacterium]
MFDQLKKYKNNGHFFFKKGDHLSKVSAAVPELPEVYYILRLAKGKVDLVYIGMSGSMLQNGQFKSQLLKKLLNNIQGGVKRQLFFENKIALEEIDALDIYWYVTFDKNNQDLPAYVEGQLMQDYFRVHGTLPVWNKDF